METIGAFTPSSSSSVNSLTKTQGSLRAEPLTMAASDDHVLVFERVTGKRKGKTLDTKEALVFKLENGIVTEVTELQSDYPTVVQFWS